VEKGKHKNYLPTKS